MVVSRADIFFFLISLSAVALGGPSKMQRYGRKSGEKEAACRLPGPLPALVQLSQYEQKSSSRIGTWWFVEIGEYRPGRKKGRLTYFSSVGLSKRGRWWLNGALGAFLFGSGLCVVIESGFLKHESVFWAWWVLSGTAGIGLTLSGVVLLIRAGIIHEQLRSGSWSSRTRPF